MVFLKLNIISDNMNRVKIYAKGKQVYLLGCIVHHNSLKQSDRWKPMQNNKLKTSGMLKNLFSLSPMLRQNKLECFVAFNFFGKSYIC